MAMKRPEKRNGPSKKATRGAASRTKKRVGAAKKRGGKKLTLTAAQLEMLYFDNGFNSCWG